MRRAGVESLPQDKILDAADQAAPPFDLEPILWGFELVTVALASVERKTL